MKKFSSRLKYYLIGFGIGLIFMFFLFGPRACSWLPENRVKNMIAEKEIFIGDSLNYLMNCQGVSNEDIYRFLNKDGDVDFGDSDTKGWPKKYVFSGDKDGHDLMITYMLYEEWVEVVDFKYDQKNCETVLSNENKHIVPIPRSEMTAIIESHEMRILETAECQMKCYKLKDQDVFSFHLNADVVMEESDAKAEPNAYYTLEGKIRNQTYRLVYVIGEARTRISDIQGDTPCDCN
ncbi:MAG: hypothetical protein R2780_13545 [Crocinitomicaceae bacterium]